MKRLNKQICTEAENQGEMGCLTAMQELQEILVKPLNCNINLSQDDLRQWRQNVIHEKLQNSVHTY